MQFFCMGLFLSEIMSKPAITSKFLFKGANDLLNRFKTLCIIDRARARTPLSQLR